MPSLLLVLTGADQWTLDDGTHQPTGFWAEELTEPMRVFRDAGVDVTIATPGGVRPTVDEASLGVEGAGGEERAAAVRGEVDALADQSPRRRRSKRYRPTTTTASSYPAATARWRIWPAQTSSADWY